MGESNGGFKWGFMIGESCGDGRPIRCLRQWYNHQMYIHNHMNSTLIFLTTFSVLHNRMVESADTDVDIELGMRDMQNQFPSILYNLYQSNWFTTAQYNAAVELINDCSMTMLNAYINYQYDHNISKVVELVLRRVIHSKSQITLPPFTDINTNKYINAHIQHLYNTAKINQFQYQYLQAQLYKSNVVLEASLASVIDNDTDSVDELHDTLIRLSNQYVRHIQYINSIYSDLQRPAIAYIQWYYKRCLDYKSGADLNTINCAINSADCMYICDLVQYEEVNSNSATDVLYGAMDNYISAEQSIDTCNDQQYQAELAVHQDELDDTLSRLSQRWRLDCSDQQQHALRQLEQLISIRILLRSECELLEELVYQNDNSTIDIINQTYNNASDPLNDIIDLTLQPEYTNALSNIDAILQQFNKLSNTNHVQPLTLAGIQYIQKLIDAQDPTLLSIGALYGSISDWYESYDSISRLSNRWRVTAPYNQQKLLVLLNHLIDSGHIPHSMGETLESQIFKQNSLLLNEFDRFTAKHNDNQDNAVLDQNWNQMWNVMCDVLAQHHTMSL